MTGQNAGELITATIREVIGGGEIADLHRLTGGASRQTWYCRVDGEQYVVQRQRSGGEKDMDVEVSLLRAGERSGVPAPKVVGLHTEADGTSSMVTRFVEGETIARKILRDDQYAAARSVLTSQLGRAAAKIHRIDVAEVSGLEAVDPVDDWRVRLDELGEPHPTFELAFRWLEKNRPEPCGELSIVHGDFRLGNLIIDSTGLSAVIDWELAHLGDPLEDLGWLCVPAWRFGSPQPVAGVGSRDQLIEAYEQESGRSIDPESVFWWEISGILRWGIICIAQAQTHRLGVARSHELAAIGRRVCETEHDLFLALEGRW